LAKLPKDGFLLTLPGVALIIRAPQMKATLKYLLKTQSIILTVLLFCTLASPWRHTSLSVLAGGLLCLLTTVAALLVFRRLPQILPARQFLRAVALTEILKWLIVVILGAWLIRHGQPLGILAGFAITYTAYFWAILKH
jgi:ATP synthase I chain